MIIEESKETKNSKMSRIWKLLKDTETKNI